MKRFVCILLGFVMVLGMFTGCAGKEGTDEVLDSVVETADSVVAEINGVPVTRAQIGDELLEAEKSVISNYINSELLQTFFDGIEITDEELELQLELLKNQVGVDSWDMYLAYYGGGSEDAFREMLRNSLKQEKYISNISEGMTVEDEELQATYAEDPDYYNIAVLDVVFLDTEANYTTAIDMYKNGATLAEISEAISIPVSEQEHTFYKSDSLTWSAAWADVAVGDLMYTTTDSGAWLIGQVVEKHEGIEDALVLDNLKDELLYDQAYAQTEKDYADFLKKQVVTVFGEAFALVEDTAEGTDGTDGTVVVDPSVDSTGVTEDADHDHEHDHEHVATGDTEVVEITDVEVEEPAGSEAD